MVHAYLMYGYPTQTVQETIDSLEMVRQLFEAEVIQSGFWHQFALTTHSPVGLNPDAYGITPHLEKISFANNDVQFTDSTGINHSAFSFGLKKSLYNYMHGICFDTPLREWFDAEEFQFDLPATTIPADFIIKSLYSEEEKIPRLTDKLVWIGNAPAVENGEDFIAITLHSKKATETLELDTELGEWLVSWLSAMHYSEQKITTFKLLKDSFEKDYDDIEALWFSEEMDVVRDMGLLVL